MSSQQAHQNGQEPTVKQLSANQPPSQVTLTCTQKCRDAMAADAKFRGRERQYCVLLTRSDAVSQKASTQMRPKVDLSQLIAAGYLQTDISRSQPLSKPKCDIASKLAITTQRVKPLRQIPCQPAGIALPLSSPASAAAVNLDISPMLQFAAGID